jgi:hypothetical protein
LPIARNWNMALETGGLLVGEDIKVKEEQPVAAAAA